MRLFSRFSPSARPEPQAARRCRGRGFCFDYDALPDGRSGRDRRFAAGGSDRARRGSGERAARCRRHRLDRRNRSAKDRRRPHPGIDRARPRRNRATHRGARTRRQQQLGGVRAHQQQRRTDRSPDRRPALPHGRLRPVLARPWPIAHRGHHTLDRRSSGASGGHDRRYFPHHARPRHRHHLRRRTAHRQTAADLFVGAGRLQGQGQLLHSVLRHRHRHRRSARAVPHHPVRGEGLDHVSGRRRARLGGADLYRHRLRLLGQGVRHVGRRRTRLARLRRGNPVGDAAGLSVRLSQSVALACALRPHHHRLACGTRRADRGRGVRSRGCRRHRPHVACRHRRASGSPLSSISRRTASTVPCC